MKSEKDFRDVKNSLLNYKGYLDYNTLQNLAHEFKVADELNRLVNIY
jgi:hypothetical protein